MKILITGTDGFIGKNIYNELKSEHDIITINDDIFNEDNWINKIQDILDTYFPEVIYHVGACSDTLETDANYMMTRNYEATRVLVDWVEKYNKKIIYSSSAANYGINKQYPSNLYGWSKYVAEQYVLLKGGIALRYFNVYGPHEEYKNKMASVAYQAWYYKQTNKKDPFKLLPQKPTRDFVYVKDIVKANIYADENYDNLKGKYYEVGSGESRSFESVLELIGIDYDYKPLTSIPDGYQFYTCSDKNKWLTGWNATYNLEKGLQDYIIYLTEKHE
jgi:ADP-L-glycero-D-manno-heptose 6-epimerase